MLNEKREFWEYSCPIPDPDALRNSAWEGERDTYTCDALDKVPQRLRFDKITDDLSGIRRALTIVARRALQGDPARLDFARNCLNLWCGFVTAQELSASDAEDAALVQALDGWLPRYLRLLRAYKLDDVLAALRDLQTDPWVKRMADSGWGDELAKTMSGSRITAKQLKELRETLEPLVLSGEKCPASVVKPLQAQCDSILKDNKSKLEDALQEILSMQLDGLVRNVKTAEKPDKMRRLLAGRKKDYQSPALMPEDESESDLHAVAFDAILADALDQGPLRELALVSTKYAARESLYQDVWMNKKKLTMDYAYFDEWEQQLMKLTAMVLLTRRPGMENGYPVPFSWTEADNYIGTNLKKKGVVERFGVGESDKTIQKIFKIETLSFGVCMMNMSDDWLQRCGWKLVEQSELSAYPGRLCFTDEEGLHPVPGEVGV